MLKLTKNAHAEIDSYDLAASADYAKSVAEYTSYYAQQRARYGRAQVNNVSARNMLKALRMLPRLNTPDDWARLHVTEAVLRAK